MIRKRKPMSQETKDKIRKANTGKIRTSQQKEKLSKIRIGKKLSEETKLNMGLSQKKRKRSEEELEKIRKLGCSNKGRIFTDEHKKKISESHKGRKPYKITEQTRKKMSLSRLGKKLSEETKKKIGLANKGNKNRLGSKATNESRKKMSLSHKGKKPSNETKLKRSIALKKVIHTKEWNEKVSKSKLGSKNPKYKNGKYKTCFGYVKILSQGHIYSSNRKGYILEHRAVVENFIKRALKHEEKIHHINGIKDDNRIENLMLFPSDRDHQKFHLKIKQFGMTNPIKNQIKNRWEEYEVSKKTT